MSQYDELVRISKDVSIEYRNTDTLWDGSPFSWIKECSSSRKRGAIGEKLVSQWLLSNGYVVSKTKGTDSDRQVNGKDVEIKVSTLWNTGVYRFQQLRDQSYKLAICLGISPFELHCWVIPKEDIMRLWSKGMIRGQHCGINGNETAWFQVDPSNVPTWLIPYGGSLESALTKLGDLTKCS